MIVRAEETLAMIQNVAIPYIEAEGSKDWNLHTFEIVFLKMLLNDLKNQRKAILSGKNGRDEHIRGKILYFCLKHECARYYYYNFFFISYHH